jgi:hypothetical protein
MTTENSELIEQMIREAKDAPEPGANEQVVHEGDETLPAPMILGKLKSAGYVTIYDNRTGESSLCNRNMLPQALKKKREDGSFVFTTIKPAIKPMKGSYKCLLHPDDPNRAEYDLMGLPVCHSAHLKNEFEQKLHMQKKHKREWAVIEERRKEAERQEDRAFQKKLSETLSKTLKSK